MEDYSWVKVFKAIGNKVANYQEDQKMLINFLNISGIKVPKDEKTEGMKSDMEVIDPFSFIALALVGGDDRKITNFKKLLLAMDLEIESPVDFMGAPSVQNQNAYLFSYTRARGESDIKILWQLFKELKLGNVYEQTFSDVLNIKQVGFTKLTQYMFYYYPEIIFPIDSVTKPFLLSKGITLPDENWLSYSACLKQIKSVFEEPFYEISFNAWKAKQFTTDQAINYLSNNYSSSGKTKHINAFTLDNGKQLALDPKLKTQVKVFIESDPKAYLPELKCLYYDKDKSRNHHLKQHAKKLNIGNEAYLVTLSSMSELEALCDWYNGCDIPTNSDKSEKNNIEVIKNMALNQILFGPPGTGKTYSTVKYALDILGGSEDKIESIQQLKNRFPKQVEFVTFHQSFSYEDFVEGLKVESTEDGKLSYKTVPGIFKRICEDAIDSGNSSIENFETVIEHLKDSVSQEPKTLLTATGKEFKFLYQEGMSTFRVIPKASEKFFSTDGSKAGYPVSIDNIKELYKNPNHKTYNKPYTKAILDSLNLDDFQDTKNRKPYVLIIDEINRGNISKIFGELITLIEPSKRAGESEHISITLPYSKKSFSVPSNVYIIGTMNTADASIAKLDVALRRRFEFTEMPPNPSLLNKVNLKSNDGDVVEIDLKEMLTVINQRIELLYDRDHTIGHSFFMKLKNDWTISDLAAIFEKEIIPLLQEYFFDDWERIHWVLDAYKIKSEEGQKLWFVRKKDTPNNVMGVRWNSENTQSDFVDVWELNAKSFSEPQAYIDIYRKKTEPESSRTE